MGVSFTYYLTVLTGLRKNLDSARTRVSQNVGRMVEKASEDNMFNKMVKYVANLVCGNSSIDTRPRTVVTF